MEISPNIHRIEVPLGPRRMAMHLLVGRRIWLIDTGIAGTPEYLNHYLRQIRRSWDEVDGAVITHCDADHCGGNGMFKQLAPHALIVAHPADAPMIANPGLNLRNRYDFADPYGLPLNSATAQRVLGNLGRATPVNRLVDETDTIELGNRTFSLLHTPGHTPGHLIVFDPAEHVAVVTDAVLGAAIPAKDGRPFMAPTYRHLNAYLQTIHRLRAMCLSAIYPTHFPAIVGPEAVAGFLEASERFVHRVAATVRDRLSRQPMSLGELIGEAAPDLADWRDPHDPSVAFSLCYPLAAHLDDGVARGTLRVERVGGINRYGGTDGGTA